MAVGIPMINIAGFCFNTTSVIAIDMANYTADPEERDISGASLYQTRLITLHLVGPTVHVFEGERADKVYDWFLELTGQKKHEMVSFPDRSNVRH